MKGKGYKHMTGDEFNQEMDALLVLVCVLQRKRDAGVSIEELTPLAHALPVATLNLVVGEWDDAEPCDMQSLPKCLHTSTALKAAARKVIDCGCAVCEAREQGRASEVADDAVCESDARPAHFKRSDGWPRAPRLPRMEV